MSMDVHLGCPWKSQLCLLLAMSMEVHLGCSWKCDLGDLWNMHMYLRCNVVLFLVMSMAGATFVDHVTFDFHISHWDCI